MKRRNFVKTLASLAAVGALPGVAAAAGHSLTGENASDLQGPAAASPRAASAGNFSLEINGTDVGFLESVEGGNAVADVLADGTVGGFTGKRLGNLAYEPLKVTVNAPPQPELIKYLNESFAGKGRGAVAIVGYDFNYKVISYRELTNAYLSELGFELLDFAGGKAPLGVQLTFQPEAVRTIEKTGTAGKVGTKQKIVSSFRFTVAGVDDAGDAVAAVALPTAKLKPITKGASATGKYDLSTFTVDISAARAKPYLDWFEKFAIKRGGEETTAKLDLMTPDLKSVVSSVSLTGVGISALRTSKQEAGTEKVVRMEATLYAEQLSFGS